MRFALTFSAFRIASASAIRRFVGTAIAFLPLRYGPVTLPRFFDDFVGRAAGDDLAAEAAGAGAEVEQAVGAGDDFAVVLDDEQRVAEVAEFVEGGDQAACCRAGGGRSSVRRGRRARRRGRCRPGWRGGCAATSPPESVGAARPRVRYSRPTSTRNVRRLSISRISSPAIFFSSAASFHFSTVASSSPSGSAAVSRRACGRGSGRRPRRRAGGCRRTGCIRSRRRVVRAGRGGAARVARLLRGRGRGLCIGSGRREVASLRVAASATIALAVRLSTLRARR